MFFKAETLVINEFKLDTASFAEALTAIKYKELGGTAAPLEARALKRPSDSRAVWFFKPTTGLYVSKSIKPSASKTKRLDTTP